MTGPTSEGSVDKNIVDELYAGLGETVAIDTQFDEKSKTGKNLRMTVEFGNEEKELGIISGKVKMSDKQVKEIAEIRRRILNKRKAETQELLKNPKNAENPERSKYLKKGLQATEATIKNIDRDLSKIEDKDEISK